MILTERSQHLDHVGAVVDSVSQVLLMLLLDHFSELCNSIFDLLELLVLGSGLLLQVCLLGLKLCFKAFIVLLLALKRFELGLAGRCFFELALGCVLFLLSLDFESALFDRQ